jgi:hypothetical protein
MPLGFRREKWSFVERNIHALSEYKYFIEMVATCD